MGIFIGTRYCGCGTAIEGRRDAPMRSRRFPREITLRRRLWHRLLNFRDHVVAIARALWRGNTPLWGPWRIGCEVCGSRFWTFSSRNWCRHCAKRWPYWHSSRMYGFPTRLEVWRGVRDACEECGHEWGHSPYCAAVN